MADQSHNKKGLWPLNPDAVVSYLPVKASTALAAGDAIILTSNQVDLGLAASAELAGVMAESTTTAISGGTLVGVYANPSEKFVGKTSGANALAVGAACDIEGGTGAMLINENATSTNVLLAWGAYDPEEVDTSAGRRQIVSIRLHAFAEVSS